MARTLNEILRKKRTIGSVCSSQRLKIADAQGRKRKSTLEQWMPFFPKRSKGLATPTLVYIESSDDESLSADPSIVQSLELSSPISLSKPRKEASDRINASLSSPSSIQDGRTPDNAIEIEDDDDGKEGGFLEGNRKPLSSEQLVHAQKRSESIIIHATAEQQTRRDAYDGRKESNWLKFPSSRCTSDQYQSDSEDATVEFIDLTSAKERQNVKKLKYKRIPGQRCCIRALCRLVAMEGVEFCANHISANRESPESDLF